MTDAQRETLRDALRRVSRARKRGEACVLHHGDCVGADEEAHTIATAQGFDIEVHPPIDGRWRAYMADRLPDAVLRVHTPTTYLFRNVEIVRAGAALLACPRQAPNQEPPPGARGEGTWWTIRKAVSERIPVVIVWPDGTSEKR